MLGHSVKAFRHLRFLMQSSEAPWNFMFYLSYSDSLPKKSKHAPLQVSILPLEDLYSHKHDVQEI